MDAPDADTLLRPGEVAARIGVDIRTVARWVRSGRLKAISTPGGARRYRWADVVEALPAEGGGGERDG